MARSLERDERILLFEKQRMMRMKKMMRTCSAILAVMTLILMLGILPAPVYASELEAPVPTIGNVASSGKVKLTWEPVEGAVKYEVYRATSKTGTYSRRTTTTGTTFTNTNATVGKLYYYYVRAYAADGTYVNSKKVSRTVDLPRPVVTASNVASTGSPRLKWEAVEGATKYTLYIYDGNGDLLKTSSTTKTAVTHSSAEAGKTYTYKVKALCGVSAATSAYSSAKARTCDLPQPKVESSKNTKGQPRLTWEAIDGAVQYKVYRSTSKDGSYSCMKTTTGTSYTNTTALDGTTYYYKVRAIAAESAANSAYSAIHSVRAGKENNLRYVKQTSVYLYKQPTSSSSSVRIPYMTELVLGDVEKSSSSGKWYEIYYKGDLYYIWITPDSDKLTDQCSAMDYKGKTKYQQEVIDLAMTIYKEWDTKYVSTATGEKQSDGTIGFDCSGFSCYVLDTVMQKYVPTYRLLPNTSSLYTLTDIYNIGYPGEFKAIDVELEDAQPGDMVFFKSSSTGKVNHCGLYMGNNEFMHCTSTYDCGVNIMPLTGSYADRLLKITRFIPEEVTPANTTRYINTGCRLYEDRKGTIKTGITLSKKEAVTVLFVQPDYTAYIRTADGDYGFVWAKYLSKSK